MYILRLIRAFFLEILNVGLCSAFRKIFFYTKYVLSGALFFLEDGADISTKRSDPLISPTKVRAIAFYLPQFHSIPENDVWWGKGFTEWVNVRKGRPFFSQHYQPHVPHPDLGYYDLSDFTVMEKQVSLAKQAGIYGFCFYHYWFSGKRLLEAPVGRILKAGKPDFPFCLCWANENWTRRWDGQEKEILIRQDYSKSDDMGLINSMIPALRDSRYIRVDGRPIILVYRLPIIPCPQRTFDVWRKVCIKEGIGEIYLAGVSSFFPYDPIRLGLNAIVEFPPHLFLCLDFHKEYREALGSFQGKIFNYYQIRDWMLSLPRKHYKIYRGVMPSWDNTARCDKRGSVFIGSSPAAYYAWLDKAVRLTEREHRGAITDYCSLMHGMNGQKVVILSQIFAMGMLG